MSEMQLVEKPWLDLMSKKADDDEEDETEGNQTHV